MSKIPQLLTYLLENNADSFLNHAIALEYIKEGNSEQALFHFQKNIQNHPKYIATYYHLGKLLESMQETDKAIKVYETGMEIAKELKDQHAYSELRSVLEDLIY